MIKIACVQQGKMQHTALCGNTSWVDVISGQGSAYVGLLGSILTMAGGWNQLGFKFLSNPNHSMIP